MLCTSFNENSELKHLIVTYLTWVGPVWITADIVIWSTEYLAKGIFIHAFKRKIRSNLREKGEIVNSKSITNRFFPPDLRREGQNLKVELKAWKLLA